MTKLNKILICVIAGLALALIGVIIWGQWNHKKNKNWEHNYRVLQDSVEVVTTKYGEVLYERGSLILEKKELEDALGITKKQIRDYEKTLGSKLAYISKLEAQLKIKDTIKIKEIVHDTLSNSYTARYSDKWLEFNQRFSLVNPKEPIFDVWGINMNVPLKVGLTDNYTIFVQSDNPYFNVTDIEGAAIDKGKFVQKQRRFVISAYLGLGVQYGLIHKTFDVGPQAGVGVGIRIW